MLHTPALNVGFAYDQPNVTTGCAKSFPLGRLTQITDASGSTTYCYDRRGNVTRKTQVTGSTTQAVAYTWNLSDRLASITYPSGGIATYARNAIGQVISVTWKVNSLATPVSVIGNASYYPFGPLNVLTYGNGRTLTKAYDQNYAIDRVASSDPNGLILDLTTDVMGTITEARDTLGATTPTRKYQYDRLYRLKEVDTGANVLQEGFGYSKTGDRTSKTLPGQSSQVYTYLAGTHRLASVGGVARSYDANGNTASLPNVPNPLIYDDRNRLAEVSLNGTGSPTTSSYTHNGRGERVRKISSGSTETTTHLAMYDETGHLLREHTSKTCGGGSGSRPGAGAENVIPCNGSRLVELIYLDDQPIAQVTDNAISYLETDHLGTPRLAANPATNAWQWKWSFFGPAFGDHAPTQATTGGIEVSLRYPGQQFDPEAGLHYNYFRDYEPGTGRYMESDPIGLLGGISTYAYVRNAPTNLFDPTGLEGFGPWTNPPPDTQCAIEKGCASKAFRKNYSDMRQANWIDSDKYFHCKANCEATKCGPCGYDQACLISNFREDFDQGIKGDPAAASAADQVANNFGRDGARKNPSMACSTTCASYRPPGLTSQY